MEFLDHWSERAIDILKVHLPKARKLIRIATGFFTVQGYDLIRPLVPRKHVQVMVGYDELSHERLRDKLLDDIMLYLSRWDETNRREAVLDLVAKLQRGEFQITDQLGKDIIDARLRHRDHGKVYIIDSDLVLSGSANLTVSGMLRNAENLAAVDEPGRVEYWCTRFEMFWTAPDTQDLTQALLVALLEWLKLRIPYDVYLKTIQALVPEDDTTAPRDTYKMPVAYQKVVIERTLRQLRQWRGSMIVASTGLGKTVMAVHTALRLFQEGRILNVLVFAPVPIHPDWKKAFTIAGVSAAIYTRNLLDQPTREHGRAVKELTEALEGADEKTLIIIDETQYFVNKLRATVPEDRKSFARIGDAVNSLGSFILLLTATPLVKAPEDLNSQLYLLPHAAPPAKTTTLGQHYLLPPETKWENRHPWMVQDHDGYFEDFMNLPVVTVMSTSYVAKTFAQHTERGDYIEFGASQRWIPQIELRRVRVPVPFEAQVSHALDKGFFKHTPQRFIQRGKWRASDTTIEKEVLVAWTSSPKALADVLKGTIDDSYNVEFRKSQDQRKKVLQPILDKLLRQPIEQDVKFMVLCDCLREARREGRKVLVFVERLATCMYLEESLKAAMPELRIANVVQEQDGEYVQKEHEAVLELILDFAPEANAEKTRDGRVSNPYDVFITTDAYGVGVNLEDASVVVNYDLAWTADTIIQRAGRVLRFWKEPRRVLFYVFVGDFTEDRQGKQATRRVEERLRKLTARSRQAERFSEMPMIPDEDVIEYRSLAPLSSVSIDSLGVIETTGIEEFTGVSPFLRHITVRNQNLAYADSIPDDISSAMTFEGLRPLVFLLVRYDKEYHWALYDIRSKELRSIKEDELLDLIECDDMTPIGNVDPDVIEHAAQECRRAWCEAEQIERREDVERICTLYLKPRSDHQDLGDVLRARL